MTVSGTNDEKAGASSGSNWRGLAGNLPLLGLATVVLTGVLAIIHPALGVFALATVLIWVAIRRLDFDATTVLTLYIALLFLIPARWVVPALGAIGTPASLVALGCGLWWVLELAQRREAPGSMPHPTRVVLVIFFVTVALSFVAAFSRHLDAVEASGAIRALLRSVGFVGVALIAAEGIRSRQRFDVLINRLLDLGAVFASVGIIQFFTDYDPVTSIELPVLRLNQELAEVAQRSIVDRVGGTALHPIEFGAVLAMLLPLALHTAFYSEPERAKFHWFRLGLIALAIPLSVSRTAVLVCAVVFLAMWPAWEWRRRVNVLLATALSLLILRSAVPGLLGTIKALFLDFGNDPSIKGRTEDFSVLWTYVGQRPVLGRGLGTFDPQLYFFVDNEMMLTLVSGGLIGVIGLLSVVVGSAALARQVYWHGPDAQTRHLGASLAAAIVGAFAGFFTFDTLSFPIVAGMFFLFVGLAGALWRLEVQPFGRRYLNERSRPIRQS